MGAVAVFAQIVSGELDLADLFFLAAVVLFIIDVVVRVTNPPKASLAAILTVAGLACMAFGFLLW